MSEGDTFKHNRFVVVVGFEEIDVTKIHSVNQIIEELGNIAKQKMMIGAQADINWVVKEPSHV